jgi:hypothetical protein
MSLIQPTRLLMNRYLLWTLGFRHMDDWVPGASMDVPFMRYP